MSKSRAGKLVPASLHSELSEYNSLLRTLRTNDTLDVVSQLAKPSTLAESDSEADQQSDGLAIDLSAKPVQHVSPPNLDALVFVFSDSVGNSVNTDATKRPKRDTWTRWPLLAGDIVEPEWQLRDEVRAIASRTLTFTQPAQDSLNDSGASPVASSASEGNRPDATDDHILPQSACSGLAFSAATHLSSILSTMSVYGPRTGKSRIPRSRALNWEDVLDAVEMQGVVGQRTLASIRTRMADLNDVVRQQSPVSAQVSLKRPRSERLAEADCSVLTFMPPDSLSEPPVRKRKYVHKNRAPKRSQPAKSGTADVMPDHSS